MAISDTNDAAAERLSRLTVRLPSSELEQLRAAAYRSRQPVAVLARTLLLGTLSDGELPAPAPPARAELSVESQQLLGICHGLTSNLSQLEAHAIGIGEPAAHLVGPGNLLQQFRERAREIGLLIKRGEFSEARCTAALGVMMGPAQMVNAIAHSLNDGRGAVSHAWLGQIAVIRNALLKI